MRQRVVIVCLVFIQIFIRGQDIHFSQYNGSVLNLSPAFTGFFEGDYRFNGIFRKQWQAVPVPYTTVSMSAEGKVPLSFTNQKNISYGLLFNNDKAGDALYTINQIYLNTAYLHKLKRDSSFIMNIGFSLGYVHNAFNYNRMTFDAQFDGLQYNASAPTNENFYRNSLRYFDFSIGTALKHTWHQKLYITYAFSILHLNKPVVTYYANTSSRVDRKISNYVMLHYPVQPRLFLLPEFVLSVQGRYYEFIPGAQLSYLINPLDDVYGKIGLYFRTRDAVILRAGLDYQTTFVGISYDINVSKLVPATNSRGGFEMYVIHILKSKKQYLSKKKPCPVFL